MKLSRAAIAASALERRVRREEVGMGIWMEMRCEARTERFATEMVPPEYMSRCLSADNNGPMDMARDTSKSVSSTLQSLFREAKRDGWKKTSVGWVCPGCAAYMEAHGITAESLNA